MENVGAYIHIPFCRTKCDYCSFDSLPLDRELMPTYLAALTREILELPDKDRFLVESLYFGGGTPSLLREEDIKTILAAFGKKYQLTADVEITIESNPGSISKEKVKRLVDRGVNRISIGVQSFSDDELAILGRKHTAQEAESAFLQTREGGIDNINIDLIYAIPGQRPEQFAASLRKALELRPDHISLYSLTLEEGTPLCRRVEKGDLETVTQEADRKMYDAAASLLTKAGYDHYEISNFAMPSRRCRHNLFYWHNLSYLGFGSASVSCVEGWRRKNVQHPAEYVSRMQAGESLVVEAERLGTPRVLAETLMLGLRLVEGVERSALEERFPALRWDSLIAALAPSFAESLLEEKDGSLRLTHEGLRVANAVFQEILALPLAAVLE